MISGGSSGGSTRLAGLHQSKSQPGLVKIRATAINAHPIGDVSQPHSNSIYKQTVTDSTQSRR